MKKIWAIRKDAEAVSPVIATILMVAITVVLAAVLYVMVLGFGGTSQTTPNLSATRTTWTTAGTGYKFALTKPTADTSWSDVEIVLQSGTNSVKWGNADQTTLTGANEVKTQQLGVKSLGGVSCYVNVTDMGGDGFVSLGDYFTITGTWTPGTSYTMTIMHEPTDGQMAALTWAA